MALKLWILKMTMRLVTDDDDDDDDEDAESSDNTPFFLELPGGAESYNTPFITPCL
jgi:hypothetical protein